jgi:hypothetical protein
VVSFECIDRNAKHPAICLCRCCCVLVLLLSDVLLIVAAVRSTDCVVDFSAGQIVNVVGSVQIGRLFDRIGLFLMD